MTTPPPAMTTSPWQSDLLDLDGYLARLGLAAQEPSRDALNQLHEQHVRTFTFDNVDVLLGQHPGVTLEAIQEKFVGRGRGGYCFEHSSIFAAALERLGYTVTRRLGRVGDPHQMGRISGRHHLVVEVLLNGERLFADPGFGLSIIWPIPLVNGYEEEQLGRHFRIVRSQDASPTWRLERLRNHSWEIQHTTDELPVHPSDVLIGHHYTSTSPASHFTQDLVVSRQLPEEHVTLTTHNVTIRRDNSPAQQHELAPGEFHQWLTILNPHLTSQETDRLNEWVSQQSVSA